MEPNIRHESYDDFYSKVFNKIEQDNTNKPAEIKVTLFVQK